MKRILIVDDVQDYLNSLSRALSEEYHVVKAADLEEAKAEVDNSIALALIDVRLSENDLSNRDGIIFLRWLKENYVEIPAVMMSAYKDFETAVDAINLGADRYLKKPINLKELKEIISMLIKSIEAKAP